MLTMQLSINIDAQRFIQQIQLNNQELEREVQKGLDAAIEELSTDGIIEQMIKDAAKKNIMDSFTKWIFKSDIRKNIEEKITSKLSAKIEAYTDKIVNEVSEKLNLPND